MSGIKCFILGFCFSVSCVAIYTQIQPAPATNKKSLSYPSHLSIDLFRNSNLQTKPVPLNSLFMPIQKQSIAITETKQVQKVADISPEASFPTEGLEDDEILSINMDADIPIEFSDISTEASDAEILLSDNENKSAMLPKETKEQISESQDNSPWVVAKTRSNVNNQKLLEKFNEAPTDNLFTEDITQTAQSDDTVSYKVAEKIKQSIIFPIPNEILNDENLTPTFINKSASSSANTISTQKKNNQPVRVVEPQKASVNNKPKDSDKSILTSISTWFAEPPVPQKNPVTSQKKVPPTYNSELVSLNSNINQNQDAPQVHSDNLASLYESLQQIKKEHTQRKIIPSELKLSFQPGRAEISGSTLQWLKIFSEASFRDDTFLQVRLDASASTELQKRRLNLLYTIFMNNGVDFNKIDTVFSYSEADAFIIRTIRRK